MLYKRYRGRRSLGSVRIPPLPQAQVLEDRTTGTPYLLSHTGDAESMTLELATSWSPRQLSPAHFGPYAGPWLTGGWRLYIDEGTLQVELPSAQPASPLPLSSPVYTRKGFDKRLLRITVDPTGALVYTEVQL